MTACCNSTAESHKGHSTGKQNQNTVHGRIHIVLFHSHEDKKQDKLNDASELQVHQILKTISRKFTKYSKNRLLLVAQDSNMEEARERAENPARSYCNSAETGSEELAGGQGVGVGGCCWAGAWAVGTERSGGWRRDTARRTWRRSSFKNWGEDSAKERSLPYQKEGRKEKKTINLQIIIFTI